MTNKFPLFVFGEGENCIGAQRGGRYEMRYKKQDILCRETVRRYEIWDIPVTIVR